MSTSTSTSPAEPTTSSEITRVSTKEWSAQKKTENLLEEDNWQSWRNDAELAFSIAGLTGYVTGSVKRPDATKDALGASNWKYNDDCTKVIIRERLSKGQKSHTLNCKTAKEMWTNLLRQRVS
jgi:hypothetical protein